MRSDRERLVDILEAIEKIERYAIENDVPSLKQHIAAALRGSDLKQ